MSYAADRVIYDADSHLMEGLGWLRDHADASVRDKLPNLEKALARGGANADTAIARGERRIGDAERTEELAANVIASAKGWEALGAMDPAERTRAVELLGFRSQLVFSTFSVGLFAFSDDLELVYGGTAAHNRMVTSFCADDDRLVPVGFLPLNDTEKTLAALDDALKAGCGALWMATVPAGKRSPAHKDNDPVWAAIEEAGVPIVLHIGGGRTAISSGWHRNGHPRPTDLHGGGENLRAKDFPAVHHSAEIFLTSMILDGVFERFPRLRCGVTELGATWAPSLMARLDYAAKSFARTEPLLKALSMPPSDYVRRQIRFTPFPGEDVAGLIAQTSPELYLFSSDYPHPEGTRDPIGKFEASFDAAGTSDADRERFYASNYRELFAL
jgi:predicted TIM-barrel fold metal-dependent hydrolase